MPRPIPRLDAENRAFWTGGADGVLRIMHCNDCDSYYHPPKPVCRHCLSDDVELKEVSGSGVIDTYTVNYQKWMPDMEVPYVIARVAVDGAPGVYLTTNIVGCPVDSVELDDRVHVKFEHYGDIYLPLFEKVV